MIQWERLESICQAMEKQAEEAASVGASDVSTVLLADVMWLRALRGQFHQVLASKLEPIALTQAELILVTYPANKPAPRLPRLQDANRRFVNVLLCPDNMTFEAADEAIMRKLGWVKAVNDG